MSNTKNQIATLRNDLAQMRARLADFQVEVEDYQAAAKDGMSDSLSRLEWAISYEDGLAQKCEDLVRRLAAALAPIRAKIARLERLAGNNPSSQEAALAAQRAAEMRATYGLVRAQRTNASSSVQVNSLAA